jgi:putative FmdB family regulatory protein
MPIYEYRCTKGHVFDTMQRFSDDPLTKCEVCGAPAQRVMHAPAVHFKGSGFYNTDYGTKKRAREMKESKEGVSASSKGDSSSDSGSSDSSSSSEKKESSTSSSDSSSSSGKTSETTSPAAK